MERSAAFAARRETGTMPWWLSQSAETGRDDYEAMRRRFVEASRRAEIIAMVNEATSEDEVVEAVCAELCEAFEAEIGFVVIAEARYDLPRFLGCLGLTSQQQAKVLGEPLLAETLQGKEAWAYNGPDLFGIGAKACALAPFHAEKGERVLVGTIRLYPQEFDEPEIALLDAVSRATGHALERSWLTRERIDLVERLEAAWLGTAEALAAALEAKDSYTADHASSIAELAVEVGQQFGLDGDALRDLRYGAIFHDIGKIAIPDAILNKPGPLTAAEFEVIKRHPIVGEQILAPVPFLDQVRRVVRHDHERWDGKGYPDGLKGRQIPIGARIVLVVDAFHAMVSDRSYRKGMSEESARLELRAHAGTQFDPDVVEGFLRVLDRRGGKI
jgi:HD-GYP domain-containing protein (c-di-GMP phosphodiesterase class II)